MKIDIDDLSLEDALGRNLYLIPEYQRPYSWGSDNLIQFWDDLMQEPTSNYFLGSVVVYKSRKGQGRLSVIDGQQRLTTATIFLSCLRRKFEELQESGLANAVHRLIERTDLNDNASFVLHSEQWGAYMEYAVLRRDSPYYPNVENIEDQTLNSAIDFFSERIDRLSESIEDGDNYGDEHISILKSCRDAILRAQIVQIELDSEEDAFVIFETLNTRGMSLRVSELFKNVLFRLLDSTPSKDSRSSRWEDIRKRVESKSTDSTMDLFLYHFYASRYKLVSEKDLYPQLKDLVDSRDSAQELFDELQRDSLFYRQITDPKLGDFGNQHQFTPVVNGLEFLQKRKLSQSIPFLLSLFRARSEKRISDKSFISAVRAIEHFQFLIGVSGRSAYKVTGGLRHFYAKYAQKLNDSPSQRRSAILVREVREELEMKRSGTDEVFLAKFKQIEYFTGKGESQYYIKYILCKILNHLKVSEYTVDQPLSIEHIYPQSGVRADGWTDELVGSLGNLAVMNRELNGEVGDKPFRQKAEIFEEYGFLCDRELRTSIAERSFESDDCSRRVDSLASTALKAWKILS